MSSNNNQQPGQAYRDLAAHKGVPLPPGYYAMPDSEDYPFISVTKKGYTPAQHYQGDGWKFHLSVDPRDVPQAFDIVTEIVAKYGIQEFKVTNPERSVRFNQPGYSQAGKQFTLYGARNDPNFRWDAVIAEIEQQFEQHGIRSSASQIPGDRMVPGSKYAGYRNEIARGDLLTFLTENQGYYEFDPKSHGYISAKTIRLLIEDGIITADMAHNPCGYPDDLANINFATNRPAPAAPAKPQPVAASSGADVKEMIAEKIIADEVVVLPTNRGITYLFTGTPQELQQLQAKMLEQGIDCVMEPKGSQFGEGLRIKSSSADIITPIYQEPDNFVPRRQTASLGKQLNDKLAHGEAKTLMTSKGKGMLLTGTPEELTQLQAKLAEQGIASVMEPKGGQFGEGLRIKSDSMEQFDTLLQESQTYIPEQDEKNRLRGRQNFKRGGAGKGGAVYNVDPFGPRGDEVANPATRDARYGQAPSNYKKTPSTPAPVENATQTNSVTMQQETPATPNATETPSARGAVVTSALGVGVNAYMTFGGIKQSIKGVEQIHDGNIPGGVANLAVGTGTSAMGALGVTETFVPGSVEKMAGRVIAENFERANMALMLVQGAVEIATAPADQKGMAAVKVTTNMTSALATGEVVSLLGGGAAAGILLPIGAAIGTGMLLDRAFEMDKLSAQHANKMNDIVPDNAHSHLQLEVDKLQNTMLLAQFGDGLIKTADGKIDFNDQSNLDKMKASLGDEKWKSLQAECAKLADQKISDQEFANAYASGLAGAYVPAFANEKERQEYRAQLIAQLEQGSLQGLLAPVQLAMQARDDYFPKEAKLALDADGKIDLKNYDNLDVLKEILNHQREVAKQGAHESESVNYYWNLVSGERKLRTHIAQEEILKTTDIAIAELNQARWGTIPNSHIEKTGEETNTIIHDLREKAANMAKATGGHQTIRADYIYVADTRGGEVHGYKTTDDRNQPIPKEVMEWYQADYDAKQAQGLPHPRMSAINQVLYQDDGHGNKVPYGLVVWHIIDQQEMQKADLAKGNAPRDYSNIVYTIAPETGEITTAATKNATERLREKLIAQSPALADPILQKALQNEVARLVTYYTENAEEKQKDPNQRNASLVDSKLDDKEFEASIKAINETFAKQGVAVNTGIAGNRIVSNKPTQTNQL